WRRSQPPARHLRSNDQWRHCRPSCRHADHHASLPRQLPFKLDCARGYEPVAEVLFNTIGVDGYFMEYDTERAGGFEPLRLVPKNKTVVLGLVTSKTGELESKDSINRRIDDAGRYLDLDQLCLSPQCGFASTEEGNLLTEDQQWAKLSRIVEKDYGC